MWFLPAFGCSSPDSLSSSLYNFKLLRIKSYIQDHVFFFFSCISPDSLIVHRHCLYHNHFSKPGLNSPFQFSPSSLTIFHCLPLKPTSLFWASVNLIVSCCSSLKYSMCVYNYLWNRIIVFHCGELSHSATAFASVLDWDTKCNIRY